MIEGEHELDQPKDSPSKSQKWRDRLKDKASKLTKNAVKSPSARTDNDVSDFLRPSIDTHRPANFHISSNSSLVHGNTVSTDDNHDEQTYVPYPTRTKRRRTQRLRVTFTDTEPTIIGEGGDEAELPTKDVVGSWNAPAEGRNKSVQSPPNILRAGNPDEQTRRSSIQRIPTRKPVGSDWEFKRQSMHME